MTYVIGVAGLSSDVWKPSRSGLERPITEGNNPVGERQKYTRVSQVPRDTRNPVGIRGDHPPRLNTPWRPIVHEYREGKVKRTPGGE